MSSATKNALWVIGLTLITAAGAQFLALGGDVFNSSLSTWQVVVNSGIAAVIAYVISWAVPFVKTFGIGSKSD